MAGDVAFIRGASVIIMIIILLNAGIGKLNKLSENTKLRRFRSFVIKTLIVPAKIKQGSNLT